MKESKKDSQSSIDPVIWENYFKSLNSIPSKFQCKLDEMKNTLNIMEQQDMSTFSMLDFKICDKEIIDAISKLKANKSGGLQLISNNMIKIC